MAGGTALIVGGVAAFAKSGGVMPGADVVAVAVGVLGAGLPPFDVPVRGAGVKLPGVPPAWFPMPGKLIPASASAVSAAMGLAVMAGVEAGAGWPVLGMMGAARLVAAAACVMLGISAWLVVMTGTATSCGTGGGDVVGVVLCVVAAMCDAGAGLSEPGAADSAVVGSGGACAARLAAPMAFGSGAGVGADAEAVPAVTGVAAAPFAAGVAAWAVATLSRAAAKLAPGSVRILPAALAA
jgi:hypothetical protein